MSDLRLREFHRTWKRTGLPADELRYLHEAARLGRLAPEWVGALEYGIHEPFPTLFRVSTKAIETKAPFAPEPDILAWVVQLCVKWGGEPGMQAAARVLKELAEHSGKCDPEALLVARWAIEWTLCPEQRATLRARGSTMARELLRRDHGDRAIRAARSLAQAIEHADAFEQLALRVANCCFEASAILGPEAIRAAVCSAIREASHARVASSEPRSAPG